MQIKTTPMRTVTYLGVDVQIPAHHTAVAADGRGQVYSYADTPIEITTCWRSSNSYDSPYKVPARVDFAETIECRNSLQLYPLAEANKVTAADLKGEIKNFPLHVVQAMCDEQVRQGNPFSPAVFQSQREADLTHGGFDWLQSELGQETWDAIIFKRAFHRMPAAAHTEATPHEIIQHMLDKGMAVWACVSDKSYDDARANIGRHAYRVTRYCTDSCYPVLTWYTSRKYAIPIDTATMTEITGVPK